MLEQSAPKAPAEPASALASCMAACCCIGIKERDTVGDWMLNASGNGEPSLFQKLFECQWSPKPRTPGGIETESKLRGLAGVTLQNGTHSTKGSLQTLKWAKWDASKREATLPVFGGFYGDTGVWTEPINPIWCCLMNLGRCANYTYTFTFSEDYSHATIDISANPLVLCCLCVPCCPAWCTVPRCCVAFDMEQVPGSDGTVWTRNSSTCGGAPKLSYILEEVITPENTPGKHYDNLAKLAPQQVMITR